MRQQRLSGNAMMEYAVPMAILVVAAGVLVTVTDINGILDQYFMAASGHNQSSLQGTTFKADSLAAKASGSMGDGRGGFSNFGTLTTGGGAPVPWEGTPNFYSGGNVGRGGGGGSTQTVGSNGNDRIYSVIGKGPMFDLARQLEAAGAPQEYVARVTDLAITTEMMGASNTTSPAALIAKQAGLNGYAHQNLNEVIATGGGINGLQGINDITNSVISVAANIESMKNYNSLIDPLAEETLMHMKEQYKEYTQGAAIGDIQCRDNGCNAYVKLTEEAEMRLLMHPHSLEPIYKDAVTKMGTSEIVSRSSFYDWFFTQNTFYNNQKPMEDAWDKAVAEKQAAKAEAARPAPEPPVPADFARML